MGNVKLKELVDIFLGVTHTPEYVFDGVPFLSVKDISDGEISFDDCKYISQEEYDSLSEGAKPKVGDMLFCRVGTLGKPIIIPEGTPLFGSFVSLGYLRNKDANRCDMNYLRYWMYSNSFWQQVNANVKGASQVNLNTGWLSKFNVVLPEMEQQKYRIATLDQCNMIIRKRKQQIEELDNLIKARFIELFGDPIKNTQNRKTTEFVNVVKMQRGFDLPVQDRQQDGEIAVYGSNGVLDHHDIAKVQGGGVITGRSGTIGKVFYTEGDYWPLNTTLFSVDTHGNNVVYLAYLLELFDLTRFVEGTGVPTLNRNMFHNKSIIDVDLAEQKIFAEFVKQVDKSKVVA
ncbi:MAG: hypothetical protein E7309_09330 [Butyrivibrio sp.]|nr:hypothetical protein [Butyrivibrio sp.]